MSASDCRMAAGRDLRGRLLRRGAARQGLDSHDRAADDGDNEGVDIANIHGRTPFLRAVRPTHTDIGTKNRVVAALPPRNRSSFPMSRADNTVDKHGSANYTHSDVGPLCMDRTCTRMVGHDTQPKQSVLNRRCSAAPQRSDGPGPEAKWLHDAEPQDSLSYPRGCSSMARASAFQAEC